MAEMREARHGWHKQDLQVVLVPTMGALHDGHLSLFSQARNYGDIVLATIFVNPKQFGPGEDFAKYPRMIQQDIEKLTMARVDAAFLPNAADMYPQGFQTCVSNKLMSKSLCGASRPGHFDGVLTVVMKLFNIAQPHVALFGKKDYQQWRIISQMVEDLNMPVRVIGCETIRDQDGLAKSSRNAYLQPDDRQQALALSQGLKKVNELFVTGERRPEALIEQFNKIIRDYPHIDLDYFSIRSQDNLAEFSNLVDSPAVALVAAHVGKTRLIDNIELNHE